MRHRPRPARRPQPACALAAVLALGLALVAGDLAASPERGAPSPPGVPKGAAFKLPRAEVERDLALEIRRTNAEPFEASKDPRLEVWLVNRSRSRAYPIVLPSDGSEVGWREPRVSFSLARLSASGTWEALPEPMLMRCGNFDSDWAKDVIRLAPGAARKLPWYSFPTQIDLGEAKRVRVVARYAYGEGAPDKGKPPPSMAAMPSFEIESSPLELAVERPLALELVLRGPLPRFASSPLAPSIDVRVENRGPSPLPFAPADAGVLTFEADLERASDATKTRTITVSTDSNVVGNARDSIAPGQRRSVLTASTKTGAHDGFGLVPPGERVARVRARYDLVFDDGQGQNRRALVSPWVPVPPALLPR
jgi:hypothetical protein